MLTTFQVKLPVELTAKLSTKLETIKQSHEKELSDLEHKIKSAKDPQRYAATLTLFRSRTKMITLHNLVRLYMVTGLEACSKSSDGALVERMAAVGVSRGRPNGS